MRPSKLIPAALVAFTLAVPTSAGAASGDLDIGFGNAGISVLDLGGEDGARAVTTDAGGRIIVAGGGSVADASRPGATLPTVVRFLSDGTLDPAFGGGDGIAQIDTGRQTGRFEALMSDGSGRVVGVGTTAGFDGIGSEVVVARFLDDGTPDPTFGASDVVTIGTGGLWVARDALIDEAGRIAIATMSDGAGGFSPTVIRLLEDGTPDQSFGTAGVNRVMSGRLESVAAITRSGTDGLVLAGTSSREDMTALRIGDDGRVDVEFGKRGFAEARFRGTSAAEAVTQGPRGRIVLVGSCECGRRERVAAASLGPRGGLDRTFGDDGRIAVRLGGPNAASRATAVTAGPPGTFNIGAAIDVVGPNSRAALVRMTKRGKLDTRFSGDGISSPSFRFNGSIYANNTVEAVAIDGSPSVRTSKILLAGSVFGATTDLAVARLEP